MSRIVKSPSGETPYARDLAALDRCKRRLTLDRRPGLDRAKVAEACRAVDRAISLLHEIQTDDLANEAETAGTVEPAEVA